MVILREPLFASASANSLLWMLVCAWILCMVILC